MDGLTISPVFFHKELFTPAIEGAHTNAFCVPGSDAYRIFINTNPTLILRRYDCGKRVEEGATEGVYDN